MKALFIGGTGNISAAVTEACATDWDLFLLTRGNKKDRLAADIRATFLHGDINDEEAVAELIKDMRFDAVVNFVNYSVAQVERDIRLFSGKTRQYIFISTASVYQKPLSGGTITESTLLSNPFWEYSRIKIECEELLIREYRAKAFPVTIVRPSHTYDYTYLPTGIHGKNGSWPVLARMLAGKPLPLPGDGTTIWTMTHSSDFARGFKGLMGNPRAIGESFHITSDETLTWNQIYEAIGSAAGVKPNILHVPTDFLCACDPSYTGTLHGDKSNNAIFDNSKIKKLVPGFYASVRFDIGIRKSVQYLLEHTELHKEDPEFDRFCDALFDSMANAAEYVKKQINN
ncbi:MAG: SDR family oxidoreductase [Defluviitaleaceae bacterium]|nr:SDR family oxidoreductase [Defluviitaleaceae bacterium]